MTDARMIDVGAKPHTHRQATARCDVVTTREVTDRISAGTIPKGDVIATARVAGIMAAKQTPQILPLCHPLLISHASVDARIDASNAVIHLEARVETTGQTGVEMEALCAVAAAALCIHDMCKMLDPAMVINDVCLVEKHGGRSGDWYRPA